MEKFSVNSRVKFSVIEELNSEFTLCKCYVMGLGKNRNYSAFSKEATEKALPSLNYVPVVAHLFKDDDGNYRIGGHDYAFTENGELKSLCVPFGVVKENTYGYETVNEYGTDVEYVTTECILWTGRYPELKEAIYSDDVYFNQSMEICVSQFRPLEEDSNYTEILDFEFSALCLLNKSDNKDENVEPCFISASMQPVNFSTDDFAIKLAEMKEEIAKCFNLKSKEGDYNVNENTNEKSNLEPDTLNQATTDGENSNNDNDNSAVDPQPETFAVSDYQLTANEKREKIYQAIHTMDKVTNESDTWYYLADYDDNYAYVEQYIYDFNSGNGSSKVGRVGYSITDNEAKIVSGFEEMRVMWLTLDEADSLEEARNNYSVIKEEVEMLRPYKLAVEKAEREKAESEIFAKYDARIGEMPEYIALKEKSNEYELEQLDRECIMLVGMFAMREVPTEKNEEQEKTNLRFSVETTPKKASIYGDWFERYGNNEE